MALPPLSAFAKPVLPEAVFLLLTLTFLRLGFRSLKPWLRSPRIVILAALWILIAWPLAIGVLIRLTGLAEAAPGVALALAVTTLAPPVMSAPSFAILIGLDASLSLALLLASLAAAPIIAPLMAGLTMGEALPLTTLDLAIRLAVILGGSWLLAGLVRRTIGEERIAAAAQTIDGLTVLVLFVFAVAIMDGVAARLVAEPWLVLGLTALTIVLAAIMMVATWLVFLPAGRDRALALALAAGNRNMGLMAAAMAGALPDLAWVFFAVGQLPIYMTPLLAQRLARAAGRKPARDARSTDKMTGRPLRHPTDDRDRRGRPRLSLPGFLVVAALALSATVAVCLHRYGFPPSLRSLEAAAMLAGPPVAGVWFAAAVQAWLQPRAGAPARFCAILLSVVVIALPLGGFVFTVQHVATYPQPFPFTVSKDGLYVLGWSTATALYLYLSALPLYLPWTPLALVALAALWAASGRR